MNIVLSHPLIKCTNAQLDDEWKQIKTVIEMKNRVSTRLAKHPPFYDIIQLVTYMVMTDADVGDLVQCISVNSSESSSCKSNPIDRKDQARVCRHQLQPVDAARAKKANCDECGSNVTCVMFCVACNWYLYLHFFVYLTC